MSEREPTPNNLLPIRDIRARLDADHAVGLDPVLGAKHTFALPEDAGTLTVFPTAGITRVETPTASVQVSASPRVETTDDTGITLDLSDSGVETTLTVHPDGTVLFSRVPGAAEQPTTGRDITRDTVAPLAAAAAPNGQHSGQDVPDDPSAPRPAPTESAPSPQPALPRPQTPAETTEPEPRVQLTGRLGRAPTFRTSPRGTQIGSFSLAVHEQDGATTWHSIVAFGTRAEQLQHRVAQGELGKGQEVNVVGYQHTREMPTKTGSRTVTEIHAVAVMKRS